MTPITEPYIEVCLVEPLIQQFQEWLDQRGLFLFEIKDEELVSPTYTVGVKPEVWQRGQVAV